MSGPVVTRFAPSPTGYLHIGGARTALFNHYFALANGGEMRLRIEDTDRERSTEDAKRAILEGLDWLGVKHDGDVVYQSERDARHREVAEALLETGAAYRCDLDADEEQRLKAEAREAGVAYRSPNREASRSKGAIRLRIPDGKTTITDSVQGEITWDNAQIEDFVLLRADGTPTYMLAVVADDHDMGVTHVIRGDDHLSNAPKQQLIYEAMGWDVPVWAHVPLIHGPDGKKLSKRHGALGVEAYRDMGYMSSAMRNYLIRLGWAHGDDEIFFDDAAVAKVFSLDGLNSAPARLDFDKMDHVSLQHIEHAEAGDLIDQALPFLEEVRGEALSEAELARVRLALPTLRPRAKTLKELAVVSAYLFPVPPISLEGKAGKPFRRDGVAELMGDLTGELEQVESANWTSPALQSLLSGFVEARGIGFGQVGAPVRAALTRGLPSPDLSDVMEFLGRDETLARLHDALNTMKETTP